jgi:hypothetical protein
MTAARWKAAGVRRSLRRLPVSDFFVMFADAGGDPGIFCYRMGVGILSAGHARFIAIPRKPKAPKGETALMRNQVACSNPFSIFYARFLTQKD